MDIDPATLPNDVDALKAAVIAGRVVLARMQTEATAAQAQMAQARAERRRHRRNSQATRR